MFVVPIVHDCRKRYKLHNFLIDLLMVWFTCGLWLVWIFVREMGNR